MARLSAQPPIIVSETNQAFHAHSRPIHASLFRI